MSLSTQMQQLYKQTNKQTTATRKQTKRQMQRINQTIEREKCGKLQNYEINARNLLGHVGRLLGVADELVLALRQPRDVRDHQEAGRDYHGRNLVHLLVHLFT